MSQYFILSTTHKFTEAAARRINKRIKALDSTADFVGPLSIPGSYTTGWLERPNDGSNDYHDTRARNAEMAAIVRAELGMDS